MAPSSIIRAFGAILAAFGVAAPAAAQEDWRFQLTPYVWGIGLDATVSPDALPARFRIDRSASDLLSDLEGAFFLTGSARRGRLVVLGDFTYTSIEEDDRITLPLGPGGAPVGLPFEVENRTTTGTLLVGYQTHADERFALDVAIGARAYRVRTKLRAEIPPAGVSAAETETWIDPIVALRLRADLAERWSVIAYLDGGGFGVGSQSTWQAYGTVNYRVTDQLYVSAGYRQLEYNYDDGAIDTDVSLRGPLLGLTWRF
jgi:opacity protein-like surface antigen